MSLQYILDGYNVIKCVEEMADCSLDQGRDMLLRTLAHDRPQGSLRNQVTVVFDGKDGVWGQKLSIFAKIIFSSGETADDYIKRMIDRSKDLKNIIVVTNDGEIACYVRKSGAKVLSVQEFMFSKKTSSRALNKKRNSSGTASFKSITRVAVDKINKEMEDVWINRKGRHS